MSARVAPAPLPVPGQSGDGAMAVAPAGTAVPSFTRRTSTGASAGAGGVPVAWAASTQQPGSGAGVPPTSGLPRLPSASQPLPPLAPSGVAIDAMALARAQAMADAGPALTSSARRRLTPRSTAAAAATATGTAGSGAGMHGNSMAAAATTYVFTPLPTPSTQLLADTIPSLSAIELAAAAVPNVQIGNTASSLTVAQPAVASRPSTAAGGAPAASRPTTAVAQRRDVTAAAVALSREEVRLMELANSSSQFWRPPYSVAAKAGDPNPLGTFLSVQRLTQLQCAATLARDVFTRLKTLRQFNVELEATGETSDPVALMDRVEHQLQNWLAIARRVLSFARAVPLTVFPSLQQVRRRFDSEIRVLSSHVVRLLLQYVLEYVLEESPCEHLMLGARCVARLNVLVNAHNRVAAENPTGFVAARGVGLMELIRHVAHERVHKYSFEGGSVGDTVDRVAGAERFTAHGIAELFADRDANFVEIFSGEYVVRDIPIALTRTEVRAAAVESAYLTEFFERLGARLWPMTSLRDPYALPAALYEDFLEPFYRHARFAMASTLELRWQAQFGKLVKAQRSRMHKPPEDAPLVPAVRAGLSFDAPLWHVGDGMRPAIEALCDMADVAERNVHLRDHVLWLAVLMLSQCNLHVGRLVEVVPAKKPVDLQLLSVLHSDTAAVLKVAHVLEGLADVTPPVHLFTARTALLLGRLTDIFAYETRFAPEVFLKAAAAQDWSPAAEPTDASDYCKRAVDQLLKPAASTLRHLAPVSRLRLMQSVLSSLVHELCSVVFGPPKAVRLSTAGVHQLDTDIEYIRKWVHTSPHLADTDRVILLGLAAFERVELTRLRSLLKSK